MSNTKSFSELKKSARIQMSGKTGTLIGAMFLELLIIWGLNTIVSNFISGTDMISTVIYYIVMFIVDLLVGTIYAGMAYLHLKAACGMQVSVGDMFHVIQNAPDRAIKIQLVLTLISYVLSIPTYIYSYLFGDAILGNYLNAIMSYSMYQDESILSTMTDSIFNTISANIGTFYLLYALIIICSIATIVISIGFMPVFYMMLDFPDMRVKDILSKSWQLMKGYKGRYFGLQLSFIGYFILSLFTMFIPLIWVIPYMSMTNANFYLDLIATKNGATNTENTI